MRKVDLAEYVVLMADIPKTHAIKFVDHILTILSDTLSQGESIYLRGFGTLKPVTHKAHVGHDFKRSRKIHIPARRIVKFIPSEKLIARLNKGRNNSHGVK